MAVEMYFAWGQSSASVAAGETVSVSVTADMAPSVDKLSALFSPYAAVDSATTSAVVIRGVSAGSITVPANRDIAPQSSIEMTTYPSFTLTVTAPVEDESYLNKRGLTHFWANIDDIKQDKLTAGTGISITGNTISATGGGVADSVAWGHITGTMADQTDLNTALSAKVNSTSLAAVATSGAYSDLTGTPSLASVATSGSYNDLSNKPTIPAAQVNSDWNASSGVAQILNKPSLATVATTGAYSDLTGTPSLATVATSGSYNDLSNKPTIPAAQVNSDWDAASGVAQILNKPTNVSAFTNDAGYITSYTDNKVTQTNTNPTSVTTYYPVASASSGTNTADVKKFSGFNLKYYDNDGGDAELVLGQNSFYSPIEGKLTLWNSAASQKTTTIRSAEGATINQLLYSPYTVDALGGRLIANSVYDTATGSATHPVYADAHGILQQTTYTLEKSVPSDAVFTDTTYSDATTSTSGLMSASDKTKLDGIASGAEVNVQSDWNQTTNTADDYIKNKPSLATVATSGSYNDLSNKPTIPAAQVNSDWDAVSGVAQILNKPTLATVATSGSYSDLSNKPTIPAAQVQSNWTQTTTTAVDYIKNKPSLAAVATSGSYNDLSNKPTIPAAQVNSDWDAASGVAQILNKPTIPTVNNATLTIQKNSTNVATFTANASSNVTANISVPTATSDLTNNGADGTDTYVETAAIANFITAENITSTSALTPPVQTNMIANNAVTTAKIDFSDYTMGSPTKASASIDNPNAYNYYIKFGRLVIVHINLHATATINSGTDILTGFPVPIGRVCFALAGAGMKGMRGRILEGTGAFQCDDAMAENYYNGSCVYWSAA